MIFNKIDIIGIFSEQLNKFASEQNEKPNLCLDIISEQKVQIPAGKLLIDEYVKWIKKPDDGYFIYSSDPRSGEVLIGVDTDGKWENIIIRACENIPCYNSEELATLISGNVFFMLGLVFRNTILRHDGFVIHSSSIDYDGKGIIFSAPSGTGKSTHVKLWNTYYGEKTRVINDDTPVIRIIDNTPYLFGSPWCGSSFIGINDFVKLKAMVAIERGDKNRIRQLSSSEALAMLLPRVFMPFYDESLMDLTISSFERVLSTVPAYLLSCTIDHQAVELVRSCVK